MKRLPLHTRVLVNNYIPREVSGYASWETTNSLGKKVMQKGYVVELDRGKWLDGDEQSAFVSALVVHPNNVREIEHAPE